MDGPSQFNRMLRIALESLIIALFYFVLAQIGFQIAIAPGNVAPIWPAAGMAAAVVYILGPRAGVGIWLGSFLANVALLETIVGPTTAYQVSAITATGSTVQALVLVSAVLRWVGPFPQAPRFRHLARFIAVVAPTCVIAATAGVGGMAWAGLIATNPPLQTWLTWWLGDFLGVVVMLPLLLMAYRWARREQVGQQAKVTIFGFGIGFTLVMFLALWRQENERIAADFAADANTVFSAIQRTVQLATHEIDAVEGLYASVPEVDRQTFSSYIQMHDHESTAPGVVAMEWIPRVPLAERAAFEAAAVRDGLPGFHFTELDEAGALIPAGERPEYYPVYFAEPMEGNAQALGFDLASNPARLAAIEAARDSGEPSVSAPITLVQPRTNRQAVLNFHPVYREDQPLTTVGERRTQLKGFVLGVLDIAGLLQPVSTTMASTGQDLYVFDTQPGSDDQLLLAIPAAGATPQPAGTPPTTPAQLRNGTFAASTLDIDGRSWLTIVKPAAGYVASRRGPLPWLALAAGLATTALVTAYLRKREHAEEEIRESQRKYQLLAENSSDVIWILDLANGRFRYVSPSVQRLRGYTPDEVLEQEITSALVPESTAHLAAVMPERLAAFQAGERRHFVDVIEQPCRDGSTVVTETVTRFVVDATDGALQVYGTSRDITERRQAEARLRQSEERYRKLVETMPDAIHVFVDGKIVFTNNAGLRLLGAEHAEQVVGLQVIERVHPDYVEKVETRLDAVTAGQSVPLMEQQIYRLDGALIDVEVAGQPITFAGQPAIQVIARDISARKRAERMRVAQYAVSRILAEADDLDTTLVRVMQAIAANLGWAMTEIWWFDAQQQVLTLRSCAYDCQNTDLAEFATVSRAYRFAPGQALPGIVWQSQHPLWVGNSTDDSTYPRTRLAAALGLHTAIGVPIAAAGDPFGVLMALAGPASTRNDEVLAALTDLGRQIGQFAARAQAQTALREERASLAHRVAERTEDLSRANAELAHALHAKDEFLANMSHELRTPLTAVLALSESLMEQVRGPLNERQMNAIGMIDQSGRHLLALINDILDLSKVEAGKLDIYPEPVAVDGICRSSLQFVQEMARKKSIRLTYEPGDTQAALQADPKRLKQILVNLLSNAVKFTAQGGWVTLTVTTDTEVGIMRFAVSDNGIGIAAENIARLFKPFTQLDSSLSRQYEGTGLGLALVRRLVELHGGTIEVASEGIPGKGTCFTVSLPWQPQPASEEAPRPVPAPVMQAALPSSIPERVRPQAARATILMAEDNTVNAETVRDFLTSRGYQVVLARDGHEAISLAQAVDPNLILMDIQMPGVDGLEAMRALRADPHFTSVPIIALTALTMPGDAERCRAAGANDYLSKPMSLSTLAQKIAEQLRRVKG